ncbi:putative membrane protein [Caulobacter ginsengisoli]|jgi:uncharacterized membrane protein|uniref:Membrane protein n=1 Tax=Caulobacter ginsengisoli TaxID=400775 RepID=A0ABU0IPE7_9CAUL|nr:DoxX family protein [Caulobacter ginsengisoli]MDQ0463834.1 putative membrane protein [Caulobacter ginsengisoli]
MIVQSLPAARRAPIPGQAQLWVCRTLGPAYAAFGVFHLVASQRFLPIMPDWVPYPLLVIQLTGLAEIAGGLGLQIPALRRWAGIGLALYAVCVFPANLHHAFDHVTVPGLPSNWWYHGPRLALQPVLVWLALVAAGVVRWPTKNG